MTTKTPKPQGISRELFNLTGGHPVQLIPTQTQVFKEKRKIGKPIQKWEWKQFTSSARKDKIELCHWEKTGEKRKDYAFADLNIQNDVIQYTKDDYDNLITLLDRTWTKEETDELFYLCKRFDLRFPIIHDKFSNKSRTIEDLKKRYYSIARIIAEFRLNMLKKTEYKNHSVLKYPYDYEGAVKRKRLIELSLERTREDELKEIEVREKLKKIEAIKKKRMNLEVKVINTPIKREEMFEVKVEVPPEITSPIIQTSPEKLEIVPQKQGTYLMSQMKPNGSNIQLNKRIEMVLLEKNVNPQLFTEKVLIEYEALRKKIAIMIDLQKKVSKKESDVNLLLGKKESKIRKKETSESTPEKRVKK